MTTATVDRPRLGLEVLIVLGVSLGQSAVYSVLRIADRLTRAESLNQQTTTMNSSTTPDRPWLDLTYQLAGIAFALVPVLLVLYLLRATHRDPFRLLGLDHRRPGFDLWFGTVIAACIGIPGLGLYLGARALGLNTEIAAANLADNWWTIPVLVLAAFQNSILEEVIMVGYLFTRLRELRWGWVAIVLTSALVRGSYHLYQGFGGFVGNAIMGVVFGLVYLKWKRVAPLVVAHVLLDIVAFVGYAVAAPHLSWL